MVVYIDHHGSCSLKQRVESDSVHLPTIAVERAVLEPAEEVGLLPTATVSG